MVAETALLLLLKPSSLSRVNADSILRQAAAIVSKRLYVEVHKGLIERVDNSALFDFVHLYYTLGSKLNRSLDLRILCGSLKLQTDKKLVDAVLFDQAKADVGVEVIQKFAGVNYHFIPADKAAVDICDIRMFCGIEGSRQNPITAAYDYAVLGGTFDRFHSGHKILISAATLLAKKGVTIGVTDELMHKKYRAYDLF